MNWGNPAFVLAIIAMSYAAWLITSWIRARHGYPLENEWGGTVVRADEKERHQLAEENAELRATIGRLEDRLKVLERIATDPAKRLSDDIDNLR